jgi:hypothetical protein
MTMLFEHTVQRLNAGRPVAIVVGKQYVEWFLVHHGVILPLIWQGLAQWYGLI